MNFDFLKGKTLASVDVSDDKSRITFKTDDGLVLLMNHEQDCCESVVVEDVAGDLADLIGSPIIVANEVSGTCETDDRYGGDMQWTFYNLATNKGGVTIRWLGESNGYYSTDVSFGPASDQ